LLYFNKSWELIIKVLVWDDLMAAAGSYRPRANIILSLLSYSYNPDG